MVEAKLSLLVREYSEHDDASDTGRTAGGGHSFMVSLSKKSNSSANERESPSSSSLSVPSDQLSISKASGSKSVGEISSNPIHGRSMRELIVFVVSDEREMTNQECGVCSVQSLLLTSYSFYSIIFGCVAQREPPKRADLD